MDFSDILGTTNIEQENEILAREIIDTNSYFKGENIRLDQTPTQKSWYFGPLFKDELYGDTYVWQIGYDHTSKSIKIVKGLLIGKNGVPSDNLEEISKSIIASDMELLQQIRILYINQYDYLYSPSGSKIISDPIKPMLCKKFADTKIKNFPVSVMKKLHGIRGLVRVDQHKKISIRSRECREFANLNHIRNDLKVFLKYLPPGSELDGEIYSHDLSFSQITSAVKTVKTAHPLHKRLQYWIFDIILPADLKNELISGNILWWENRYSILVNAYTKYLEDHKIQSNFGILQAYNANSVEEIKKYQDNFVSEGYEGLTIRRYGSIEKNSDMSLYKPGRNVNLIKYKEFEDREVLIISYKIIEDKKELIFTVKDLNKNSNIYDVTHHCFFNVNKSAIGKMLTIRYVNEIGEIPVNPVGIAIRDYE
jgi:hypothetical protein